MPTRMDEDDGAHAHGVSACHPARGLEREWSLVSRSSSFLDVENRRGAPPWSLDQQVSERSGQVASSRP